MVAAASGSATAAVPQAAAATAPAPGHGLPRDQLPLPTSSEAKIIDYFDRLWRLREKYMAQFILDRFIAGLRTTGRNEQFHAEVKDVLEANRFISASDFMFKFSDYLKEKFRRLEADATRLNSKRSLVTLTSMHLFHGPDGASTLTKHASRIMEACAFKSESYVIPQTGVTVIDEFTEAVLVLKKSTAGRSVALKALIDKVPGGKYGNRTVSEQAENAYNGARRVVVTFASAEKNCVKHVSCSCRQLPSLGIACSHIFVVLRVFKGGVLMPETLPEYLYDPVWRNEVVPAATVFQELALRRLSAQASKPVAASGSAERRGAPTEVRQQRISSAPVGLSSLFLPCKIAFQPPGPRGRYSRPPFSFFVSPSSLPFCRATDCASTPTSGPSPSRWWRRPPRLAQRCTLMSKTSFSVLKGR